MRLILLGCAVAVLVGASPAYAQHAGRADDFARGFGMDNASWDDPYDPQAAAGGPNVIVDGRLLTTSTLFGGLTDAGAGSSLNTLINNPLNVVTQGDWNTVLINSDQIHNGAAVAQGANQ